MQIYYSGIKEARTNLIKTIYLLQGKAIKAIPDLENPPYWGHITIFDTFYAIRERPFLTPCVP